MASIWEALVSEQTKTIDIYFHQILDDLVTNLTSNLWRNRESSCSALADLLRGRTLEKVLTSLLFHDFLNLKLTCAFLGIRKRFETSNLLGWKLSPVVFRNLN